MLKGLNMQIRPVGQDELGGVGQSQQALFDEDRLLADLEFLDDRTSQALGHAGVQLEPDHVAAAAAFQRGLERAHQVLGFFLHLDVTVAQHAESALALDVASGEQLRNEETDQGFETNEAVLVRRLVPERAGG